ncbi:MAG: hypothetical protein EHM87_16435 [Burkholderiales bacterium]|nr:MAG: hypothetical protein EHM87_16435 [Burkholderiales bacterium]
MRVAIMQPYLLPYIGYYQLAAAVDLFVVYDDVKYTKKGWINRNRMLLNGRDATFSLPLRQGGDQLDVRERTIDPGFEPRSLLERFRGAYGRAPHFAETFAVLERALGSPSRGLFDYLLHSLASVFPHLGIAAPLRVSSTLGVDRALRGQDRVLATCEAVGATHYVNAIGGTALYERDAFRARGIELAFLQARAFEYPQTGAAFVPWLSIVDVLMFNPPERVRERVAHGYDLL